MKIGELSKKEICGAWIVYLQAKVLGVFHDLRAIKVVLATRFGHYNSAWDFGNLGDHCLCTTIYTTAVRTDVTSL